MNEKIDNTLQVDINWFVPWLKLGFVLEIKVLGSLKSGVQPKLVFFLHILVTQEEFSFVKLYFSHTHEYRLLTLKLQIPI